MSEINIHQFEIGTMRNFVYLLSFEGEALIVDPQPDTAPWLEVLKKQELTLKAILLTHTHHDHVGGLANVLGMFNVPILVHEKDVFRLKKEFLPKVRPIADAEEIALGSAKLQTLHTPGHSAGECSYLFNQNPPALLTGDTVFVGDVGRTDLPTGNNLELFQTIQQIKALPMHTVIYPGHNYGKTKTSTIERECEESAAFRCQSVEELAVLP